MAMWGKLVHRSTGVVLLARVRWCSSYGCKLRGLMFRRTLAPDEGLLLVESAPSRAAAAIHMLFMAFPIAVIWCDAHFRVVDKALARPWQPVIAPRRPAQYTLEAGTELLEQVQIGDELVFES